MSEYQIETLEEEKQQYIVVKLGDEQYGLDISFIDNIVVMQKIRRLPSITQVSSISEVRSFPL